MPVSVDAYKNNPEDTGKRLPESSGQQSFNFSYFEFLPCPVDPPYTTPQQDIGKRLPVSCGHQSCDPRDRTTHFINLVLRNAQKRTGRTPAGKFLPVSCKHQSFNFSYFEFVPCPVDPIHHPATGHRQAFACAVWTRILQLFIF